MLVTGAATGHGRATTSLLAEKGFRVCIVLMPYGKFFLTSPHTRKETLGFLLARPAVLFSSLIIAVLSLAVLSSPSVLGQTTDFQTELLNYAGQQAIAHGALLFAVLGAAIAFAVGFKQLPLARRGRWKIQWGAVGYCVILSGLLAGGVRAIFGLIFWSAIANTALYTPTCTPPETCQDLTAYWRYVLGQIGFVHEWFAGGLWNTQLLWNTQFPFLNVENKGFWLAIAMGFVGGVIITKLAGLLKHHKIGNQNNEEA